MRPEYVGIFLTMLCHMQYVIVEIYSVLQNRKKKKSQRYLEAKSQSNTSGMASLSDQLETLQLCSAMTLILECVTRLSRSPNRSQS